MSRQIMRRVRILWLNGHDDGLYLSVKEYQGKVLDQD